MEKCPCGSDIAFSECCEPFIRGEQIAPTAEQVMRSRYTAYVQKEIDYLLESIHPDKQAGHDSESTREWAETTQWLRLEIIDTKDGSIDDDSGQVEFIAYFNQKGSEVLHHELADFRKKDGKWFFYDGSPVTSKPVVRQTPKIGRNEPCPCNSGKKYKKCCAK
jgi:SEC-C motif-containing protein